jgi:quinol monooxygenase YgiN
MTTPQIAAIARIPAKPGQRDALIKALEPLIAAVEAEEGTLRYILHTDLKDADVLWFYEQYTDNDAFAAHGSSEAMKTLGPAIGEFAGGKVDIHIIAPVTGKGL